MIKHKKKLYGWSRSTWSNSSLYIPSNIKQLHKVIDIAKRNKNTIICRAGARSYSDNTLNSNQFVVDITNFNKILNWDKKSGVIQLQGGVTIEQVMLMCIQSGWIFPSMTGTRYVTIAGALSNNIHGKNAFHRGCIGEYVNYFKIILADNSIYTCSREKNKNLFYSVISGLGLLGVIIEVELQLIKIPSFYLTVKKQSCNNLNELFEKFSNVKNDSEYSIAWVDTLVKNTRLGRGQIHFANFANDNDYNITDHNIPSNLYGFFPNKWVPTFTSSLLNPKTIRIVNWLKFYSKFIDIDLKKKRMSLSNFHFIMDMKFPNYNYFFKHGFFEYQPILPFSNCIDGFEKIIKISQKYGFYSVMSSLKAYRNQKDNFLLSFAQEGFAITMDIIKYPKRIKEQTKMFYEMNEVVLDHGGKIYFGKTPIINKTQFYKMYKNLNEFLTIKEKYDPNNLFISNMFRRILNIKNDGSEVPSEYSY